MRLRETLRENGITQKELAEKCGFGIKQVNFWCTGRAEPDLQALKIICEYLKVPSDYLIGLTDNYF